MDMENDIIQADHIQLGSLVQIFFLMKPSSDILLVVDQDEV